MVVEKVQTFKVNRTHAVLERRTDGVYLVSPGGQQSVFLGQVDSAAICRLLTAWFVVVARCSLFGEDSTAEVGVVCTSKQK